MSAYSKFGGAGRDRTADKGFADLCLTTWRPRLWRKRILSDDPLHRLSTGLELVPQQILTTVNVRRPDSMLLQVPEGRHNVAHRETVGNGAQSFTAPEGRHIGVAVCRPFGA